MAEDVRQTVLIIDDNPQNIQVLNEILQPHYRVLFAANGKDGLDRTSLSHPDIILLDIMMPGMSGFDVFTAIRSSESTKDIPIIFVSALTDEDSELKGLEMGAIDFIHKPFQPDLVRTRIGNQLELKRLRDHLEDLVSQRTIELKHAREAAEAANRAKSLFLATMSHELRTPLNGILGLTQLMIAEETHEIDRKTRSEYLNDILESGWHLLSIISSILDFSCIEEGKFHLEMSPVNIRECLARNIRFAKKQAEPRAIQVFVDITPEIPETIRADNHRLDQILLNILSNAVRFSPEGGSITLSARIAGGPEVLRWPTFLNISQKKYVWLTVTDTGIGIQPEDLPSLFTPFHQVDNSLSRKHDGIGLSLALSKKLAEAHGGAIWAETRHVQPGSAFHIALPLN